MDMVRPNPDDLLKIAKTEETYSSNGKLKIFLGYCAGVGKTYTMLEAARRLQRDGVDVAIGLIETHKRAETQALLEGLEILPRKKQPYRNTEIEEMDLDAVIARKPKIAIIDELAHTNAPGSRHTKRYQDIEELLSHGIDVYTTLNIQHLESLNDVVAKVTGVSMKETVPDRVFDEAREIEVVDLPIGELLKRLREGRIYFPEAAERAMQNFFTESNLTALRELALRRAAKRLDLQMQGFSRLGTSRAAVGEKLLVCVSSYASSAELVRAGRLLAAGLDAEWFVVTVETPGTKLSAAEKDRLARTLKLAEELDATVAFLSGQSIAEELVNFARRRKVSKILVGKTAKRKVRDIFFGTLVDQLIRLSGEIDVYVINRTLRDQGPYKAPSDERPGLNLKGYLESLVFVAAASGLGVFTRSFLEPTNIAMYYLAAVVASAIFCGRGPSVFTAVISVLIFDFVFVPPYFTFAVTDTQYVLTFFVLFAVGLVISTLTARLKEQAEFSRAREIHTASLYGLSRDLASATDAETVYQSLLKHLEETMDAESAVFVKEGEALNLGKKSFHFPVSDHETAVADWVVRNGQPAGSQTDTLPGALGYYLPFKTSRAVYGALGVASRNKNYKMRIEDRRLLESFAGQTAVALERIMLTEEFQKTRFLEEREKLQSALFNSISHDLRTPLVSITGALSGMLENTAIDEASRKELLETAYEDAGRLNRLVGNLLDMARLEAAALKITPNPCEIRDVIGSAIKELENRLEDRKVTVTIEENLPHVPMDFGLMMKVLVNLIDNAIKYAPFGLPVDIEARQTKGQIEIRVLDRGLGIPEADLEQVFGKFYRVKRPQNFEGTGLGLSICRGIVEAHHGKIWAENRSGGGTIVTVSIPSPKAPKP